MPNGSISPPGFFTRRPVERLLPRKKRDLKGASSMKAIQYRAYGGYAENKFVDLPVPAANDGQVLVRMHTVGINPLDNTFRAGHHYAATPENLPRVGGQMGAGIVVETKSPSFKVSNPGRACLLPQ